MQKINKNSKLKITQIIRKLLLSVPNYSQEQSELLEQIIKNVDEAVKGRESEKLSGKNII